MVGSQPTLSVYHWRAFARSFVARLGWIGASVMTDGFVAVACVMAASSAAASIALPRFGQVSGNALGVSATASMFTTEPPRASQRLCARIGVEAATRLLPQVSGRHEVDEDLRWRVVLLADALVEHSHHVQAHVEADEVGQLEWPHRVVEPDLRAGV